ncbi:MAG TPA: zinc-binding dehydrogenase [Candidatus Stackebrandtia excrementipullorum]|nr:zinc-binding dehydrogenase [Candidatus Stackebrandtia excrementipullorum]
MKALVKFSFDDDGIELRDVAEPVVTPDTVIVATRVVGVCGSDIHLWRNAHSWEVDVPVVIGHEIAGVVTEVGSHVDGWQVGDRVVCETASRICGTCSYCRRGQYNICPKRLGYGAKRDGFFTERVGVEPRILHRIPDNVPDEHAAMVEPFAVAFNALVERGTVRPGDHVVVQGAGAIGALSVQVAKLQGAASVTLLCTSADAERIAPVLAMGADRAVVVDEEDPAIVIAGLGDGQGADVVVDATGVSAALEKSLELVRPLGSIVKVGWGPQPLNISLDPLVAKAVTLYGSFSHNWGTWERVLDLFALGRLDAARALGGVYRLTDWKRAFEDMESGRNIKSVITFNE